MNWMFWVAAAFVVLAAGWAASVVARTATSPTGKTVGSFVPAAVFLALALLFFSVWIAK